METYSITVPDDVAEIVKEKAANRGFHSPADFLQALIASALDQEDRDRLEAMLIEGLESGPPIEATEKFWREFKDELNLNHHSCESLTRSQRHSARAPDRASVILTRKLPCTQHQGSCKWHSSHAH